VNGLSVWESRLGQPRWRRVHWKPRQWPDSGRDVLAV